MPTLLCNYKKINEIEFKAAQAVKKDVRPPKKIVVKKNWEI